MNEQERAVNLYSQGYYRDADRLCIQLQHDGLSSALLKAMRGFNALHLGRPYRSIAWLAPVVDELEQPFHGQGYINLCRAYGELNRFEEAVEAGYRAVELIPDRANSHLNLAAALAFSGKPRQALQALNPLFQAGQLKTAEGLLRWLGQSTDEAQKALIEWLQAKDSPNLAQSVQSLPAGNNPPWPGPDQKQARKAFNRAHQVFNSGDLPGARKDFLQAIKHEPNYFNAKLALVQISRMETDARSALMELDQVEKEHSKLEGNNKGQVLAERARNLSGIELYDQAIPYAQQAAGLLPKDGDVLNALGFYQLRTRDLQGAERSLKKALQLKPAHHLAMNNLASLYLDKEDDQAAFNLYKRQLKKSPGSISALIGLAHVCQVRGDFSGVQKHLRKALKIDPTDPYVARLAADADPEAVDPDMLNQLSRAGEKIDPDAPCPPNKSVSNSQLLFALSDLHSKHKDFEAAEKYLFAANRIQSYLRAYKPGQHERLEGRLEQLFEAMEPEKVASLGRREPQGPRPVLILGMPRSGSTLLERILNAHSDVSTGGEMKDLNVELETTEVWRHLRAPGDQWLTPARTGLQQEDMDAAAVRYRNALRRVDDQAGYVIDKMPGNFWWIGFILRMFPDALILHTCRDVRSTCLSCFQQNFSEGQTFSFTTSGLAHYYSLYARMMRYWHQRFPGRVLDVRYEALVTDMEQEMQRVLDYCGLKWQPEMERFYEQKGLVKTASVRQVRQPVYTSSLAKWNNYPGFVEALGEVEEYEPVVGTTEEEKN